MNIKIKENTFLVWEPCTDSHGEVIPGFTKYLLDLGYEVSILMNPKRRREGLFSNFAAKFEKNRDGQKLFFNNLELDEIIYYLSKNGLNASNILHFPNDPNISKNKKAKGIIITTARNVSLENTNYNDKLSFFKPDDVVLLVEHDVKAPVDKGFWKNDIITLAPVEYKDAKSVVVNPHYFGNPPFNKPNFKYFSKKPNKVRNFIIIGAIQSQRKNYNLLFSALETLLKSSIKKSFKITVVGNGDYNIIPKHLRKFFKIKGRLDFKDMYDEINRADFILPLLDEENNDHKRYITTGTSGTFQLSYGFIKPCILAQKFAQNRFLNSNNAILYAISNAQNIHNSLADAIQKALDMDEDDYLKMCANLKKTADEIYEQSLENLKQRIDKQL